jgi:hypothetical protein
MTQAFAIVIVSNHADAGQLNSFTHLRALLVLHDRGNTIIIINHAYAGQVNRCTHLRALMVLHDCGISLLVTVELFTQIYRRAGNQRHLD